ncbi:sialidase family protein [Flindersiella endophytica]
MFTETLLPVKYAQDSHAATLLELDGGDLLCAWFNGPGEGDPATNVVLSRLRSGETEWSQPVELAADPERSEQNPVLFQEPGGRIWLLHTSTEPHDQKTSRVVVRRSEDGGESWSDPEVLFDGPGLFLRSPIAVLGNGDWLLPAYYCRGEGHHSVVLLSSDGGRSWTEHEVPRSRHRVQMSIVERLDGSLFAMFRSRQADRIYACESADGGRSWSTPKRTELANNDSSIQVARLSSGELVLAYNDSSLERDQFRWERRGEGWRKKPLRTPLTLALSEDGGRTWPHRRNVQVADLAYRENQMGYSYPAVMQARDGRIHVAYSYLRTAIKHVVLDTGWIREPWLPVAWIKED